MLFYQNIANLLLYYLMTILDGKKVSTQILAQLKHDIDSDNPPHFDIILVGDDPLSLKYTALKQKVAQKIGIKSNIHHLVDTTSQDELISLIKKLNQSDASGIMVQLPLSKHLDKYQVLNSIDPNLDIDGLTSTNMGLIFQNNQNCLISATALAIYEILVHYQIDLKGKHIVIINNTPLIGLPLAAILNNNLATVTICHKYTQDLEKITNTADVLISAVGIPNFIKSDMVKEGAVVVGAGFFKNPQTGLVEGDLDFDNLLSKVSYITPHTGGVDPVTVACLLKNVIKVYSHGLSKNPTI